MNSNNKYIRAGCLIILPFLLSVNLLALTSETQEKLNAILSDKNAYSDESLALPENAELMAELRKLAKDARFSAARIPLIRMGDKEIIDSTISLLHTERPKRRWSIAYQLGQSGNPELICQLMEDLKRNESAEEDLSGEMGVTPLSTVAGCTIVAIVQENSLFTPQVKTWAHRLSSGNEEKRSAVRTWCEINKDALLRKDYAACVPVPGTQSEIKRPDKPVVTPKPELPPSKREPKERPPALSEAEGKKPIWPWLAGISTLAVLGVILWSRRG